jgi:hypothetical protein
MCTVTFSSVFIRVFTLKRMQTLSIYDRSCSLFKDDVHSVLRISSAHNKGGPPDINIAQILHLSNFFELKRTVYIHLQV